LRATPGSKPAGRPSRSSTASTSPTIATAPSKPWGGSTDLYEGGELPEFHDIVDTIIAWSDEILAYHHTDWASNGRIEGTNNLLQVLRRTARGWRALAFWCAVTPWSRQRRESQPAPGTLVSVQYRRFATEWGERAKGEDND